MFVLNQRFDKKTYNCVNFLLLILAILLISTLVISSLCAIYPNLFHDANLFLKGKFAFGVWSIKDTNPGIPVGTITVTRNVTLIDNSAVTLSNLSFWGYLVIALFGSSIFFNIVFLVFFCNSKKITCYEKKAILFYLVLFSFLNLFISLIAFVGTLNFKINIPGYKDAKSILFNSIIYTNSIFPTINTSTQTSQATWIWIIVFAYACICIVIQAFGYIRIFNVNFSNSYKKMKRIQTTTYAL